MSEEADYVEIVEENTNGLQIFQQDKALLDMQIVTAKRFPRNLKRCIENAITAATLSVETAKSCTFTISKGGKRITGPSVHLARIIAQKMGNMRAEIRFGSSDATHVSSEAFCFDLETNYAFKALAKKSIIGGSGRYSEDMIVITGNAAGAIAFRNAVFTVVGKDVVDKVWESTKDMVLGKVKTEDEFMRRRVKIFEGLKQQYGDYKLTDKEICQSVGREVVEHITKDDLIALIGFETAIKEKEQTFESIFRYNNEKPKPPKSEDKEGLRLMQLINMCKTKEQLKKYEKDLTTNEQREEYDKLFKTLK